MLKNYRYQLNWLCYYIASYDTARFKLYIHVYGTHICSASHQSLLACCSHLVRNVCRPYHTSARVKPLQLYIHPCAENLLFTSSNHFEIEQQKFERRLNISYHTLKIVPIVIKQSAHNEWGALTKFKECDHSDIQESRLVHHVKP